MKHLRPQPLRDTDYADVERQIAELFRSVVFEPILKLLAPKSEQVRSARKEFRNEVRNAGGLEPLVAAIRSGRVQYADGVFSGSFSAAISRALRSFGARMNKVTKNFDVDPAAVPLEVRRVADDYQAKAKELHDRLEALLGDLAATLDAKMRGKKIDPSDAMRKINRGFMDTAGNALGTESLSKEALARLSDAYVRSLEPYIKDFTREMIGEIRRSVEANARTGYRFDSLIDRIQDRYGVSKSKATFLARQETAIFTSKHRRAMFEQAGVEEYVWQTAGDARVRDDHKKLNGKRFRYDDPPIVDEATGRRGNPGIDFQCRCVDVPILPRELTPA